MGAPRHPDWYYNVIANPAVQVELGDEEFPATAVAAFGHERDRRMEQAVRQRPFLAEHQGRTQRLIPVVELQRDRED
ncbi:nitroreductase/quinone reductase family protein [Streptomyces sp. NPDC058284]|uniref:nitroreductase/quinone reductase family protein n=1 Tax=unclassified Streptomyces TaxID=2593676 RepID=UPI003647A590